MAEADQESTSQEEDDEEEEDEPVPPVVCPSEEDGDTGFSPPPPTSSSLGEEVETPSASPTPPPLTPSPPPFAPPGSTAPRPKPGQAAALAQVAPEASGTQAPAEVLSESDAEQKRALMRKVAQLTKVVVHLNA